jgi:energy-converting hydrogenase Eha subunit E
VEKKKTMFLFYASVNLAILGTILYQVTQKLTPAQANPIIAITVTYAVALVFCLVLLAFNLLPG